MVSFLQGSVSAEVTDGHVVVRLGGAVSVADVAELATAIIEAHGRTGRDVIVDLYDLALIDSAVARPFLVTLTQAQQRKHVTVEIRPPAAVWRAPQLASFDGAPSTCADRVDVSRQRTGRPAAREEQCGRLAGEHGARLAASSRSAPSQAAGGLDRLRAERGFEAPSPTMLSPRERRVLFELACGRTTDAAAAAMGLSPHTVRSHLKTAARKLGAETRTRAVALAITQGVIAIDSGRPGARDGAAAEIDDHTPE